MNWLNCSNIIRYLSQSPLIAGRSATRRKWHDLVLTLVFTLLASACGPAYETGTFSVTWGSDTPTDTAIIRNLIIELSLDDGWELDKLTLLMYDKGPLSGELGVGSAAHTSVELYKDGNATCCRIPIYEDGLPQCVQHGPHCPTNPPSPPTILEGRYYFSLDIPMWLVGDNNFSVLATLRGPSGDIVRQARQITARYELPQDSFGLQLGFDGRLIFRLDEIPIFAGRTCHSIGIDLCKDADQDGLLDSWENVAVEVLRPVLALDESEDFFEYEHRIATFVQVAHYQDAWLREGLHVPQIEETCDRVLFRFPYTCSRIVFQHIITFSDDYGGAAGIGGHHGDTQNWWTVWEVIDAFEIRLVEAKGSGHGFDIYPLPWSHRGPPPYFLAEEVATTPDGLIKVFVEEDKHGIWPNRTSCDEYSPYDCDGSRILRPPAINVGEPPELGRPFIDLLSCSSGRGIDPCELMIDFEDEAVWSGYQGEYSREGLEYFPHLRFCGGLGWDGGCATSIGLHLQEEYSPHFWRYSNIAEQLVTLRR